MKTLTNTAIVANITVAIKSIAFKAALEWNLIGTRIDRAFLGGYAQVVEAGVVLNFEEDENAFLIECTKQEAALVFSCFHNKGLFLDVFGSGIYTGVFSFGLNPLKEFDEPAIEVVWELVGPTWTDAQRISWLRTQEWYILSDLEQWEIFQVVKEERRKAEEEENRLDNLYEEKMLAMEERQYD